MDLLADGGGLGHRRDHGLAEVLRVRAREADALDPVDGVAGAQQLAELRPQVGEQVAPPRVHVLAEQRDLAHALPGEPRDLGDDLARPPAHLSAAHRRDDAVGALRVAAHRHLHPGLEAALALERQRGRERALLGDPERAARDPLAVGADPVREVRDRARAEGDVHERVQLEQALALGLRVAAADGDDRVRVPLLQHLRVAHVRGEALVGLLADRARVEDEHVGLLAGGRLAEADRLERPLDALRVVRVHLAAERRDEVPAHGAAIVAAAPARFGSPPCRPLEPCRDHDGAVRGP